MTEAAVNPSASPAEWIRGCLLGGALGDALGAPVEFMRLDEIRREYGSHGIEALAPAYGRVGAITDDTQMTLFTAEGLLRAWVRKQDHGMAGIGGTLHHAYLRWLLTQGCRPEACKEAVGTGGWLYQLQALHSRRAPGNTCLSALLAADSLHGPTRADNDSKGCGGVMRVAPVGLVAAALGDDAAVFEIGAESAAITHGHPTGYLAAGYFAVAIAAIMRGATLPDALDAADAILRTRPGHDEVAAAISAARVLARRGRPSPETIETLGGGWIAEEALAIGVCCALVARDVRDGLLLAANHSGDTDSTGSITGHLLGALHGDAALPSGWLAQLELRDEIARLAEDLADLATGRLDLRRARLLYPGW